MWLYQWDASRQMQRFLHYVCPGLAGSTDVSDILYGSTMGCMKFIIKTPKLEESYEESWASLSCVCPLADWSS